MKVTLEYFGQLRPAAGVNAESMEVTDGTTAQDALKQVALKYGGVFSRIVLDDNGGIRPSLMVIVNERAIDKSTPHLLANGDAVGLLAAMAGG